MHELIKRKLYCTIPDEVFADIPIYPEARDRKAPAASRMMEISEVLYAQELRWSSARTVRHRAPAAGVNGLLNVPESANRTEPTTPLQLQRYLPFRTSIV